MNVEKATDLIKAMEHLELDAYYDVDDANKVGTLTIGYGHTGSDVYDGQEISEARADELLAADIAVVTTALDRKLNLDGITLNENQYNALVSFAFNTGCGALFSSSLWKFLKKGNFRMAAEEFPKWRFTTVKGVKQVLPGLVTRRAREKALFLRVDD